MDGSNAVIEQAPAPNTLDLALERDARRYVDAVGGGYALIFSEPSRSTDRSALRAATGFDTIASERAAAAAAFDVIRDDRRSHERAYLAPPLAEPAPGMTHASLIVPLCWEGQRRGTVVIGAPRPLSEAATERVTQLSEQSALRIDHALLCDQLASPNPSAGSRDEEVLAMSEALFAQDIELRRNHEWVDRMEQLKNDFIEKMSRELRTPLNNIIEAIIGILAGENEAISEQAKTSLRSALDEGTAFQRTLENILDLWRLRQDEVTVDVQEVDLAGVIDEAIFSVQDALQGKEITIEKQIDLPESKIRTDLTKLNKLFFLLLDNAVKFTHAGRVGVGARIDHGRLVCVVADTGIGVCPDDLPFLCDDFYQVDAHTSAVYAGAGLGLSVAKGLLELMDGRIAFRSEPGHGTRVVFEVPVSGDLSGHPSVGTPSG
jgi:signal transduction histidine kinase